MKGSKRWPPRALLTMLAALMTSGCGEADSPPRLQVERDTIGDTVVVRTVAGSQWGAPATLEPELRIGVLEGEDHFMFGGLSSLAVAPDGSIYVMDRQVPALRKYAPDGSYVATFGREGSGPGEYKGPDGGLAVLADGRVVLRDPANARMQIYGADGEPLDTWAIRGGFNTSNPLTVDTVGRVYSQILLDPEAGVTEWRSGLVALDSRTGEPVDTVPAPEWTFDEPRLVASIQSGDGTSTSVSGVPFSPATTWTFSPLGRMVGGLSTRYAIDQYRNDGTVLRIERVQEPVSVRPDEKANREEQSRWGMRRTQPDWTWNGPPIPDRKPPFRRIFAGGDGRIWVHLYTEGERIADDEVAVSAQPDARPPDRWREPVVFDVFEPDGTYLGAVRAPTGFSMYPTPVFEGDRVWGVVRDEFDVQYIVRFRLAIGADEAVAADEAVGADEAPGAAGGM